jgi:tetratricopeptide (TPR) repeat protein
MLYHRLTAYALKSLVSFLLVFLLQGIENQVFAQSKNNLDSLATAIAKNKSYKDMISAYKQLAQQQSLQQFDKVNSTADKGIALAIKQSDSVSIGELIGSKGNAQYFKGSYDSAAHYFIASIKILEAQKASNALGEAYNNLSRLYRKTKQYKRAIFNYDIALKHFRAAGDLNGEATILNESGVVFEYQQRYAEALERY